MANLITFNKEVPNRILTHEEDERLRYKEGINIPLTPFDHWNDLEYIVNAILRQFNHFSITIGTISYEELQAMRRIHETCCRFKKADYVKSKAALTQWLKEEGVAISPEMFEKAKK